MRDFFPLCVARHTPFLGAGHLHYKRESSFTNKGVGDVNGASIEAEIICQKASYNRQINLKTHMNISVSGNNGADAMVVLATLAAIATTIFWMVVGWRAMRAHERLAAASEQAAQKLRESGK